MSYSFPHTNLPDYMLEPPAERDGCAVCHDPFLSEEDYCPVGGGVYVCGTECEQTWLSENGKTAKIRLLAAYDQTIEMTIEYADNASQEVQTFTGFVCHFDKENLVLCNEGDDRELYITWAAVVEATPV